MAGKFARITTIILLLFALMALSWLFVISKASLEMPALLLTLFFTVIIPLLTVFMIVKKQRGFTLAMLLGVVYLLLGAATVFRTMNSSDSFLQTTMYTGVAGVVLGLALAFTSSKAKKEEAEEVENQKEA